MTLVALLLAPFYIARLLLLDRIGANVKGRPWVYQYGREPEHVAPTARQALAHRLWAKERLYGGAAGGGKTDWLLAEVMRTCLRYAVPGLILRRSLQDMEQPEGILTRLRARIPRWVARYNGRTHSWKLPNGAEVKLGYLRHDGDVENYMGSEIGVIAWDQLEQFTEWQYLRMLHPLRAQPPAHLDPEGKFVPFQIGSANPGGRGHMWVKGRFIEPAPPEVVWQPTPSEHEPNPGSRLFIPATIADNPFLTDFYIEQLQAMPEDERRALIYGDWDVYAGARFATFRRSTHVVEPEAFPVPPTGYPKAVGIDYGGTEPFCALWGALFPDGLIVVYRELYKAGLSPEEQADLIVDLERRSGDRASARFVPAALDPSCWIRNPNDPKAPAGAVLSAGDRPPPRGSIADTYRRRGVAVKKANNDRLSGTARIASKLQVRKDRRPRLYIHSTCVNLIRTLPGIPRDDANPELYDTDAEDHAVDALRYLIMELDPGGDGARQAQQGRRPGGGVASETGDISW